MKRNVRTPVAVARVQQLVSLVKNGNHTVSALSNQLSLSTRQTYRYLDTAIKVGLVFSPLPGMYFLSSAYLPSFEEFVSGQFVNEWMSQDQQHNKTKHDSTTEVGFYKNPENTITVQSNSDVKTTSLHDTVTLVLTTAGFDYREFDFKRAVKVLSDSAWNWINKDNVEELVAETGRRFDVRYAADAIKSNAIGYFCGILKRVLSEQMRLLKRSYRDYVTQYTEDVDGAEENTVSVAQKNINAEAELNKCFNTRSVPPEWLHVQALLREMADSKSVHKVADGDIQIAVNHMEDNGIFPERAALAIQYLNTNDSRGGVYLLMNLRNPNRVFDTIRKNYMRYLNYSQPQTELPKVSAGQKPKDDRYSAFYELFPDA